MILSKKQVQLYNDITSPNVPEISVLGSTQSGKTHCIDFSIIQYAKELREYEKEQRKNKDYLPRDYYGDIIVWNTYTIKSNIIEQLEKILTNVYHFTNGKEYVLKYGQQDKYLDIYGMRFYFFGFNTNLSFNRILGKPLIFVWVDESARIYSCQTLQESFDEIPGRMMSYSGHPYYKRIDSYNVEGNDNHPYKIKYIDERESKKYVFYPYDNPVLDTEEKIKQAVASFTGTLREQKVFNKWVVAEGKVFNKIPVIHDLNDLIIREIGIGIDYGSVNPTTFVPIALCHRKSDSKWVLVRLQCYYHDSKKEEDNPTTEYYSFQLKMFLLFLKDKYPLIPIHDIVIDSEASHFDNRLTVDNIPHSLSKKGEGSVDTGVQHLQSLFFKDYLYIYEQPTIRYFLPDGRYEEDTLDRSLLEFQGYQYDRVASSKKGTNCYKKELDHSIDALRYIMKEFADNGRCPIV